MADQILGVKKVEWRSTNKKGGMEKHQAARRRWSRRAKAAGWITCRESSEASKERCEMPKNNGTCQRMKAEELMIRQKRGITLDNCGCFACTAFLVDKLWKHRDGRCSLCPPSYPSSSLPMPSLLPKCLPPRLPPYPHCEQPSCTAEYSRARVHPGGNQWTARRSSLHDATEAHALLSTPREATAVVAAVADEASPLWRPPTEAPLRVVDSVHASTPSTIR